MAGAPACAPWGIPGGMACMGAAGGAAAAKLKGCEAGGNMPGYWAGIIGGIPGITGGIIGTPAKYNYSCTWSMEFVLVIELEEGGCSSVYNVLSNHPFSSFNICERAPEDKQVGENGMQIRISVPEISRVKV